MTNCGIPRLRQSQKAGMRCYENSGIALLLRVRSAKPRLGDGLPDCGIALIRQCGLSALLPLGGLWRMGQWRAVATCGSMFLASGEVDFQ